MMGQAGSCDNKGKTERGENVVDTWSLVLGLLFGSIGLGYFIYGRKQSNIVARYSGIALMVFPYFIDSKYAILAVGVALMALPKFIEI